MKPFDPATRELLAAEYALGTLRGRARRRLEKLATNDADLRAEIAFWETRLSELADRVAPVTPPETVWIGLSQRIKGNTVPLKPRGAAPPASARPERSAAGPRPWRIFAGLATAAAVVVGVVINSQRHAPTATPVAPVAVATAPASYVALLKMPDSDLQWTVSLTPGRRQMTAAALGTQPAALQGRSAELWWLSSTGPVAIGVLPVAGQGAMPLPKDIADASELKLAVSLEPPGGSPTGAPTGPVVASAIAVRTA